MNYYDILGLSETSEPEVIEAAYRALMKKYHPDRSTGKSADAERKAKLINEAYSALRDVRTRRDYDKRNAHPQRASGAQTPRQQKPNAPPSTQARATAPPKKPRRPVRSAPARHSVVFSFGRSELIGAAIVLMGVVALGLAGRTGRAPHPAAQTLLLPAARASLLGGDRQQIFCITNKTLNPIQYTIFWGAAEGQNYRINAGASIVHYSRFSGLPAVEFEQNDGPIQHVRNKRVTGRTSIGPDRSCFPNYSFEYLDADIARVSEYDRFGLYPDAPPALPTASTQTNQQDNSTGRQLDQF